jgi:hypothetical protein
MGSLLVLKLRCNLKKIFLSFNLFFHEQSSSILFQLHLKLYLKLLTKKIAKIEKYSHISPILNSALQVRKEYRNAKKKILLVLGTLF